MNVNTEVENKYIEGPGGVVEHLRMIIDDYLVRRPHLSVNGISKKCNVSEPTLRRIMSRKVKTLPQTTTVLDILSFLANSTSVREIVRLYPGPIADYLTETIPHLEECDREYSNEINRELKDPIKYLIYKLSLNSSGVSEDKILEIYGSYGIKLLNELISRGFIERDSLGLCKATSSTYKSSNDDFVRNFKIVSDFIKPHKYRNRKPFNPLFVNCSDSLTPEAYEKISRLQKRMLKKMREIIDHPNSKGKIPFFYLAAIDTLDSKAAFELLETED